MKSERGFVDAMKFLAILWIGLIIPIITLAVSLKALDKLIHVLKGIESTSEHPCLK